ncbi:MAG TPA: prepilin-type N-terminal cleavage/methylation domain-containing protein [Kofleriaceae bacterium]|nr:prepilin-type N-terminal cleavage/methylation domain-containing protein [Kofleriaceae bacterium]
MKRAGQRGFTLIELMIALLVSSLLVGMILAIFSRMSLAYRGQQQIAGLQQVLAAARATIELDAKQAGLGMPQGFKAAMVPVNQSWSPVRVTNASNNPDQIAFFYADTSVQAVLTGVAFPNLTVDQTAGFGPGLAVLSTVSTVSSPVTGEPDIASYDACIVWINSAAGTNIVLNAGPPWGQTGFPFCTNLTPNRTMVYRLVAHAYRIDITTPARAALGVLQQSATGGLLGVNEQWLELAYGFSDIQTALQVEDPGGVDLDLDGFTNRNWYSGALQGNVSSTIPAPAGTTLLAMTISLVAHTDRNIEGIATAATPNLIGLNPQNPANPPIIDNNQLGDRPSTALPAVPADPLLPGSMIYRYATFQVDFRNLGIGQL